MRPPPGAIAVLVLGPVTLCAQADTTGRGQVFGVVYDSVAGRPVAGAVVQLVAADNPARNVYNATSDDRGRYAITGVEPGKYIGGFHHLALDSLAIEPPIRAVDVVAGKRVKLDLAVPAPATLMIAFCGRGGATDSTGVLIGMLRDARSRTGLDTGTVQVAWHDLILDSTGWRQDDRNVTSPVYPGGWFVLCRVPGEVDVALRGWQGADSTGLVVASVPTDGIARRDLFVHGVSAVRGSIVSERQHPIPNARVGIVGRERNVATDSAGTFHLGEVPAGSQTLEFRALGYAPELRLLHLEADRDTTVAVTLTSMKKVMDTIHVVAQRLYNRDLSGFERRKRSTSGYFFDEESIRRRRPHDLFQMLWQVPSLRVTHSGFERTVRMRGTTGTCTPELFLNGMRMPGDLLADLDLLARPDEVAGMEVYQALHAPPEFRGFGGCGSIVIWTRPPLRPRR